MSETLSPQGAKSSWLMQREMVYQCQSEVFYLVVAMLLVTLYPVSKHVPLALLVNSPFHKCIAPTDTGAHMRSRLTL